MVLALPGLVLWGFDGFVAGRIATSVVMLAVRRHYVRRLFPGVSLVAIGLRGAAPVLVAGALTLALRAGLDPGVLVELAVFGLCTAALTWALERPLLRELAGEMRARRAPGPADAAPA